MLDKTDLEKELSLPPTITNTAPNTGKMALYEGNGSSVVIKKTDANKTKIPINVVIPLRLKLLKI